MKIINKNSANTNHLSFVGNRGVQGQGFGEQANEVPYRERPSLYHKIYYFLIGCPRLKKGNLLQQCYNGFSIL